MFTFFSSIWFKLGCFLFALLVAGGIYWRFEYVLKQETILKQEKAQLEKALKEKDTEIELLKGLQVDKETALEDAAKQNDELSEQLRKNEVELAKRQDGNAPASEYLKEVMKKVFEQENVK